MNEDPSTAAASGADARRPRTGSLRLDLRRDIEAPATARVAVARWCPELAGGRPRQETLLLLVSEVVTNAVMHSRAQVEAPVVLTASVVDQRVCVAVTDEGKGFTPPSFESARPPERTTIGGYGLYVVDRAASRWGVDGEGGTRVWFEI